jgi:hypothetical protein
MPEEDRVKSSATEKIEVSGGPRGVASPSGCFQTIGLALLAVVVGVIGFIPLGPILFVGPVNIGDWSPTDFGLVGLTLGIYFVCARLSDS